MARVSIQVPVDPPEEQQTTQVAPNKRSPLTRKNLITGLVAILMLVVIFLLFSLMNQKKELKQQVDKLSSGQAGTNQDNQKYQAEVGKLVAVPDGVVPTITTLTQDSIDQVLKQNPTLSAAKPNDAILIYTRQDKTFFLVIYRPSTQKIILAIEGSKTAATPPAQEITPTTKAKP